MSALTGTAASSGGGPSMNLQMARTSSISPVPRHDVRPVDRPTPLFTGGMPGHCNRSVQRNCGTSVGVVEHMRGARANTQTHVSTVHSVRARTTWNCLCFNADPRARSFRVCSRSVRARSVCALIPCVLSFRVCSFRVCSFRVCSFRACSCLTES